MSLNVLLILNDATDAEAAQQALASTGNDLFQIEWQRCCADGVTRPTLSGDQAAGNSTHIAAVMTDLFLPDSHGIETIDRLVQAAPQIPMLILCGLQDEHIARAAMRCGAQDYLLKHQLDKYWTPKILHNMIVRTAHAGAVSEERECTLNAIGDAVISIDTHSHVIYLNAVALAHRNRQQLAVLFLDLDHFKDINDSLGHAVGDSLLQALALRLAACVRSSDSVGRLGGDEFVIVLSEVTHADDAVIYAGKILEAVSTAYRLDHHDLHITASIGIATYPDDGADAETLLKKADLAMYRAKHTGRGNYRRFTSDLKVSAME